MILLREVNVTTTARGVCDITSPLYGFFACNRKAKLLYFAVHFTMKQTQLSAGKRLTKPILFGTLIVGLATVFYNRHMFFMDVEELRAQERARNDVKLSEVRERRQKQMECLMEKKGGS